MSRPLRSALSLMGLTVAIAGMVGLFAVKKGLERAVHDTFELIPGLSVMQPGAPVPLFSRLPADWRDELAAIKGVAVVNPQIIHRANLVEGKTRISPPTLLFGIEISSRLRLKKAVYRDKITEGRFLRESDRGTFNTVVSRQMATGFNKSIGDRLSIDGHTMTIVGIYHTGMALLDVCAILDIGTVRKVTRMNPAYVSCFYLEKSSDDFDDEEIKRRIQQRFSDERLTRWKPSSALDVGFRTGNPFIDAVLWLARRFDLLGSPPRGEPSSAKKEGSQKTETDMPTVEVRSADDWAEKLEEFSQDLDIFLMIMTSIGITIAVLSIINTMLMSVTERIIEFGILKANGWSRGDVMKLITCESAVIGVAGGCLGATLGWLATLAVNAQWPEKINLFASPGLLAFSVVFSTAVGILGGLYPALWAMRMMPMDAIRRG